MNAPVVLTCIIAGLLVASLPMASQDAAHGAYNTAPGGTSQLFADFNDLELAHGRLLDPSPETSIVIVGPVVAYNEAETQALRDFVEAGGRLLVADNVGSGVGLLDRLDMGVELSGIPVYTPVFETDPRSPLVTGTGVIPGIEGRFTLPRATAVTGVGTPIMATHELAWLDQNGDGRPGLREPRGAYAYAMLQSFGAGEVLVIGSPAILDNAGHPVRSAVIAWLQEDGRTVIVDEGHRPAVDPIGTARLLAGQVPWLPWLLIPAVALGAIQTWRLRITRTPRRRRIPTHPLLQELDP